jgi:endonuclease/exonuclease/phosphatase family metal-dependent hydrolase
VVAVSRALVIAGVCAGCGQGIGGAEAWIPVEDIVGAFAPRAGAPPPGAPVFAASGTIRVVSYNIARGADPEAFAAAILASPALASADVWLIQETEDHAGEGAPRAQRLAAGLAAGWVYAPARYKEGGTHGLAILSRFPIEAAEVMALPHASGGLDRIAIAADIALGGSALRVVNVHLDTRLNITDRILQLRPALLDLPPDVVVGGDFNTNPYRWEAGTVPVVPAETIVDTDQAPILDDYVRHLGFATPTAGSGPTETMYGIDSRLDAIFTRGIATGATACERDVAGSDHWPLWIDVAVP